MDDLLADFLAETHEALAALDAGLLRLEQAPDDAPTLSAIFRAVHSIKGACGFLGLARLERVAHAAETMLGRFRDGSLGVTPDGVSLILRALDAIKAIVAGIGQAGAEPAGDDAALLAALEAAAEGRAPRPAAAAPPAAPAPAERAEAAPRSIRVAVDVLEALMTLAGELVLTRNQLLQVARGGADPAFAAPLQRLSHITSQLQDGVMRTRMQPIGSAWAKLPRLVRDIARDLGKAIEIETRGADTELDRQVLELIRDPLTHMVRNSADHGLEPPAERRAAGKPETGRITLAAHHEGGQVIIRLADDGRGLDTGRIRRKALAQGIAGEAALAAMTEAEIHRLIFHAGLSTADAVTAVSGRGVGMDVVKTNLDRIGGTVEVASRAGQGTGFTIRIPLTLAIVAALIVEVAGMRFAIPQLAVGELVRTGGAGDARVERVGDAAVLRLRDRLLPLLPLASLLGLEPPGAAPEGGFVVVVRLGAAAFGLVVDRVHDTEEIVVKPVAPILRHVAAFAGTTILGDGGVVMILDPDGIARQGGLAEPAAAAAAPAPASGPAAARNAALLLFRAGDATPKAVPLGEVARLDDIPVESIEQAAGAAVVQHRGGLLPLLAMEGHAGAPASGRQPVLVLAAAGRGAGLMADAILDVVEQKLALCGGARPGFLGSAIVAGRATDIIDTAWWVARAHPAAPAG